MPRLKMVWLPLRKWISFLPVAFIVYILLQYLVYQPEIRVTSSERSAVIGESKLINLTNSLKNVEDPQVLTTASVNGSGSRLQSGSLDSPTKYAVLRQREFFRHLQDASNQFVENKALEGKPESFPVTYNLHVDSHHGRVVDFDQQKVDAMYTTDYTGDIQEPYLDNVIRYNLDKNSSVSNFTIKNQLKLIPNNNVLKGETKLPTLDFPVNPKHGAILNGITNSNTKNVNSFSNTQHPSFFEGNQNAPVDRDSTSFHTIDDQMPNMDLNTGHKLNLEEKDTLNDGKENSISYSSSTVERSARASISLNKPIDKLHSSNMEIHQSNVRGLSGTNMNTVKSHVKNDKPIHRQDLPDSIGKVISSPNPNLQKIMPKIQNIQVNKKSAEKGTKNVMRKGKSPNALLKQAIAKNNAKDSKPKYAIGYLHGKIKVGDIYDNGFMVPQEELCPNNGRDLRVIIFVTTAPSHEHHRNAIRQTWGHFAMRRDVSISFLVGRPDKPEAQNVIDRENERYGDIIQSNVVDVYANLTLKTVSMFEWLNTYCSEVRFVLKTDDDMYINVPLLLAFIYTKRNDKRAIYGRLARNWKPVRNKKSKYYIAKDIYSNVNYPKFLTGPAYLFTSDIAVDLYTKSLDTIFFKLEDVFTTGLVAESLNIKRVGDSHFRNEKISLKDTCKLMQTISIHMVKYEEEFDIYKRTLDGKTKCKIK